MEIKVKGVAFNVEDPDQLKMLQHANLRQNFSSYIKRLIQRDMESGIKIEETTENDANFNSFI